MKASIPESHKGRRGETPREELARRDESAGWRPCDASEHGGLLFALLAFIRWLVASIQSVNGASAEKTSGGLTIGDTVVQAEATARAQRAKRVTDGFRQIDTLRDEAVASVRRIEDPRVRARALVQLVTDCGEHRTQVLRETYTGSVPARQDARDDRAEGER